MKPNSAELLLVFFVAVGVNLPRAVLADPGDLDSSFGNAGIVTTAFGSKSFDKASAVVIQADGKIVVAGCSFDGTQDYGFALARYNTDGTPDSTFGPNHDGKVLAFLDPQAVQHYDCADAVALQSDNKIVAAGYSGIPLPRLTEFAVMRFNADGSPDTAFGAHQNGGIILPMPHTGNNMATAIAVQQDGDIVLAGNARNGSGYDFSAARLTPTGSVDTSFGGQNTGIVTTHLTKSGSVTSMTIDLRRRILLAGWVGTNTIHDFALVRYKGDGNLDASLVGSAPSPYQAVNGTIITPVGTDEDDATSVTVDAQERVVVGGYYYKDSNTTNDWAMVRYKDDGSLDTGFGAGGKSTTPIGPSTAFDYAFAMALQPNGKILMAGFTGNLGSHVFDLARFNDDGSLDSTFGHNHDGKMSNPIGTIDDMAMAMALQSNGRIVVAGVSYTGQSQGSFAVARYLGDETTNQPPPPPPSGGTGSSGSSGASGNTGGSAGGRNGGGSTGPTGSPTTVGNGGGNSGGSSPSTPAGGATPANGTEGSDSSGTAMGGGCSCSKSGNDLTPHDRFFKMYRNLAFVLSAVGILWYATRRRLMRDRRVRR